MTTTKTLLTTRDIAQHLNVSSEWARQLSHTPGFPQPVQQIGHIRFWYASDIKDWMTANRPGDADAISPPA